MANFVRFRGPSPITSGMPANQCLLGSSSATVLTICRPTKFFVRTVTGAFDLTPFAGAGGVIPQYGSAAQNAIDPHRCFSGARTGVTFEGPFLRYTIDPQSMGAGVLRGVHENTAVSFFFDLVGDRMLYLPFPGSLDVVGQYPGTWDFETFGVDVTPRRGADPSAQPTPLDSNATLSLRLATGGAVASTRKFAAVPPGCHSLTVNTENLGNAGVFPTITVWQESVPSIHALAGPTALPLSTGVPLAAYGGITSAFGTRMPQHNSWGCEVSSGTVNAEGMVQFHVGFS